ncbi:hypothetical protein PS15p_205604 [Mucor circinelloides]
MAGKGALRSIKNIAKGFSDIQIKVREATSNDPWGPSGTLMNEIAQLTFNESDFIEIMDMIDKRLNDKGKNWRHVFKALLLLDYCLHVGSENVVLYARENIYVVKTLKEFQHLEENGKDVGANVRQKAKDITNLLQDDNRLKEERRQRQGMRDRMANVGDYLNETVRQYNGGNAENGGGRWDDESELKKALAESKRIAAEEERNRRQGDDDLEKALQLSQQEAAEKERKNREKLDKETADNLFGSGSSSFQAFPQQQTFVNNPYQQQQQQQQQAPLQLEWAQPTMQFSEPLQNNPYQQQQQQNPYLSNQFNANGLQAQMTGFPQQQQPPLQAQMTGFPQQQPQFLQQPSFQTSMVTGTNPFSQMSQQQQQQSAVVPEQKNYDYSELVFGNPAPSRPQQQQSPVFGSNTPNFGSNTPHFGSNTPNFSFSTPATATASPSPAFATTTTTATQFSPSPAFANTNAFAAPSPSFAQANTTASPHMSQRNLSPKPTEQDAKYSKLNALLANNDDGLDSYGNRGNLRIPYGTGFANSLPLQPKNNDMLAITDGSSTTASPQPFGQQTSRNPFGQANTTPSNDRQGQKSLLEMMQEQKQQQQQFATFNNNTPSLF